MSVSIVAIIFGLILVASAETQSPANLLAGTAAAGGVGKDPCDSCFARGLSCVPCNDGRYACVKSDVFSKNPVCCGCSPGTGSICTLCLPSEPCIASSVVTSGFYCLAPRYLKQLYYALNETRYPTQSISNFPDAGQKAGWLLLGLSLGIILPVFISLILVPAMSRCINKRGSGSGDGSSDSSSHNFSSSSSTFDSGSGGGGGSDWSSGPSYGTSAD